MKNVLDLKIIGIDGNRPPKTRAAPYIDLVFELSEKAGKAWCQDFNMLFTNANYTVRIDVDEGLYIETWVRTMDEIQPHLDMLKAKVAECNQKSHDRAAARAQAALDDRNEILGEQGEQGRLNEVIAGLDFD